MYTSMIGLMLATMTPSANLPAWQLDYRQAKALAAREHKPLAVVIGTGAANWDVVSTGSLGDNAADTLRTAYVCVYVDVATEAGQKLASEFEMKKGLVISDKTGTLQAYKQIGAIEANKLTTALTHYADPNVVVKTTEMAGDVPAKAPVTSTSNYYPVQQSSCPFCRQ